MDNKEIAFIISCNDEQEMAECLYYIDRLRVPEGFHTDVIAVREASSMAEAYNGGMNSSQAKYKVYLHQDVFILNRDFIRDIVHIFESDKQAGILGCIGTRMMPDNAFAVKAWDTGKILHNQAPGIVDAYEPENKEYIRVDAVDGLLMATQYDLPWREDLFHGWDFYDVSQCYEFYRVGKYAVVPCQQDFWCYHDNQYSRMKNYDKYREIFIGEYQDIYPFRKEDCECNSTDEYEYEHERVQIETAAMFGILLDAGKIEEVNGAFCDINNQGYPFLKEYETIANIYNTEKGRYAGNAFWTREMDNGTALCKMRHLKHLIKRIEFHAISPDTLTKLVDGYSVYAILIMVVMYGKNQTDIIEALLAYLNAQNRQSEYIIMKTIKKEVIEQKKFVGKKKIQYRKSSKIKKVKEGKKVLVVAGKWEVLEEQQKLHRLCLEINSQCQIELLVRYMKEKEQDMFLEEADVLIGEKADYLFREKQKELYQYAGIVVIGKETREYVNLFQNTEIPVLWVSDQTDISRYSRNIHNLSETQLWENLDVLLFVKKP